MLINVTINIITDISSSYKQDSERVSKLPKRLLGYICTKLIRDRVCLTISLFFPLHHSVGTWGLTGDCLFWEVPSPSWDTAQHRG